MDNIVSISPLNLGSNLSFIVKEVSRSGFSSLFKFSFSLFSTSCKLYSSEILIFL